MGRSYRERPRQLGRKLALIRKRLGLTQPELIVKLGVKGEPLYPSSISLYEQGKREPQAANDQHLSRIALWGTLARTEDFAGAAPLRGTRFDSGASMSR